MMSKAAAQAQSLVQQSSHQREEIIGLYRRCIRCANSIMDAGWRLSYLEYTRDSFRRHRQLPYSSYQAKDARNFAEEQLERMKYYISVNLQMQKDRSHSIDKKAQAEESPLSVLRPLSSLFSAVDKRSGRKAVKKIDSSTSNDEAKDEGVNVSPSLAEESTIIATKPMEALVVIDELESTENTADAPSAAEKEIDIDQAAVSSQMARNDKDLEDTKARLLIQGLGSDYTDKKSSIDQNAPLDTENEKVLSDEVYGKAVTRTYEEPIHDIADKRIFRPKQEDQEFSASKGDLLENLESYLDQNAPLDTETENVLSGDLLESIESYLYDERASKKEHEVATAKGGRVRKVRKSPRSRQKKGTIGVQEKKASKVALKSFDADLVINALLPSDTHKSADIAIKTTAVSLASKDNNGTKLASIDSNGEEKFGAAVSPSDVKLQTIESFLKEAVPFLYPIDIQTYTKLLVDDGFDSIPILENELLLEDLNFMKKAHARALWNFIQTKRK
jgi:hypothetical protein